MNAKLNAKINYKKSFVGIMLISAVIWLVCVLFTSLAPRALQVFYKSGEELFYDYYHSIGVAVQSNPYEAIPPQGQDHAYPPLAYAIYSIFRGLVHVDGIYDFREVGQIAAIRPLTFILYGLYALFAVALFAIVKKQIKTTNLMAGLITLAFMVSKPMLFAMDRSNIIMLAMLLNTFFIFYHKSDNKIIRELSLIALAISAGIKLTTALLGVMLIYDKQWKEAIRTVIYGIVAAVAPFMFFRGGLSLIPMFLNNINEHLTSYRITDGTVYGCLQHIRKFYDFEFVYQSIKVMSVVGAILVILAVPLMKRSWQKILALTMVLVFAPSVSQFYCLIYLTPAIIAFLGESEGKGASENSVASDLEDKVVFVLLMLLGIMEPKMFLSAIAELLIILYLGLLALMEIKAYITKRFSARTSCE